MIRHVSFPLMIAVLFSSLAVAQTPSSAGAAPPEAEGKELGGYQVQQSIEFG